MKTCFVALFLALLICFNNAFCQELLISDLNGDGVKEEIKIKTVPDKEDEGILDGILIVKSKGKEFKHDAGILDLGVPGIEIVGVTKSKGPYFIGINSFAGAHGMVLDLYSFDGKKIKKEIDIFSDAPSIEIKDVDKDGMKEIIAKCRDYDNSPIVDSYIKTYKYSNNRWKLTTVYRTKTKTYSPIDKWQ